MSTTIVHCPSERLRESLPFPTNIDNVYLDGTAAVVTFTVPAGVDYILISPTLPCWASLDGGITSVPSGNVGNNAALYISRPVEFSVGAGQVISFWNNSATNVTIGKYKR